ncbi:flagellar hook-length control protein FliK [Metapseudomonas resinovorans]|uniref:flagellar hook-length control protein FliK n=1 Tax=Metapseudomonas resinovorans TaxID=53412 RepID=UPI003D193DAE
MQSFIPAPLPVAMAAPEQAPLPAAQAQPVADPAQLLPLSMTVLPPSFSEELLDGVDALVETPVDAVAPLPEVASSPDVAVMQPAQEEVREPQAPAALTPEVWLLSILGQQNLQVQAQDKPAAVEVVLSLPPAAGQYAVPVSESASSDAGVAPSVEAPRVPRPLAELPDAPQAAAPLSPPADLGVGSSATDERPALAVLPSNHGEAPRHPVDTVAPAARPAVFERTLGLHVNEARWGEQMLSALRDSVELQLNQRVQSATIRLDPPELGSLEILLRHESGQLNVQISASQSDVARALQGTSERLRQELVGQNFLQVSVQVSADDQQGQRQQQARAQFLAEEVPLAAHETRDEGALRSGARTAGQDVLVTV